MDTLRIKEIKDILEPTSRYIFLDGNGMTEACLIRGVEKNAFVVYHHDNDSSSPSEISGYFPAASGKGVVRFEGECERCKPSAEHSPFFLYRLNVNLNRLSIVDRREFIRFKLQKPIPVSFHYEEKFIRASLINISEGGLRMMLTEPLPQNVIFQFELKLPRARGGAPFELHTDGLVVYCAPENDPRHFIAGVSFVAPRFLNSHEKEEYQQQQRLLVEYLASEFTL